MFKLKKTKLLGVLGLATTLLTGCANTSNAQNDNVKDVVIVELGTKNEVKVDQFMKNGKVSEDVKLDILLPKNFNEIKTYEGKLTTKGSFNRTVETPVKVVVQDHTAPVFRKDMPDQITVEQNVVNVQWCKYFLSCQCQSPYVEDYQTYTLNVEGTDKVDIKKAGEYEVVVIARDRSGNESRKNVKVKVVESKKVVSGKKKEKLTSYVNNETPISEKTEKEIVEKGVKIESQKTTVDGKEVKKGKYSTKEKQKAYEKKKAEAEKKRKQEEQRQREIEEQQQQMSSAVDGGDNDNGYLYPYQVPQQNIVQPQTPVVQPSTQTQTQKPVVQRPSTSNSGGGQQTQKPSTSSGCVAGVLGVGEFYTREEAINYARSVLTQDGFGENKIKGHAISGRYDNCGRLIYIISFIYR